MARARAPKLRLALQDVVPEGTARRVVRQIERLVLSETLRPGDRLPPEQEMARALGVSRSSVREALAILAQAGLIDRRKGMGTYVRQLPREQVLSALVEAAQTDAAFFADLLVVREALEGKAAELAAVRATREELAIIDDAADRLLRCGRQEQQALEADIEFHLAVAAASGNAVLFRIIREVGGQLAYLRRRTLQIPGRLEQAVREHRQIAEAIRSGDPLRARQAVSDHLSNVQMLVRHLDPVSKRSSGKLADDE